MKEGEIRSTGTLSSELSKRGVIKFDYWDERKRAADRIAERLEPTHPNYARRIEGCADLIRYKRCANGHLVFNERTMRYCRVRGCPICEWRRIRRTSKLLYKIFAEVAKQVPKARYLHLNLALPLVDVKELKAQIAFANNSLRRLLELKEVRGKGSIKFKTFGFFGDRVFTRIGVILMVPASTYSGGNYISRDRWTKLWSQSLRMEAIAPVEVFRIPVDAPAQKIAAIGRELARTCDLSTCPDEILGDFVDAIHRQKLITTGGLLSGFELDAAKPKKRYPSEKKAISGMETEIFVYQPNPEDTEHCNAYLKLKEWTDDDSE